MERRRRWGSQLLHEPGNEQTTWLTNRAANPPGNEQGMTNKASPTRFRRARQDYIRFKLFRVGALNLPKR